VNAALAAAARAPALHFMLLGASLLAIDSLTEPPLRQPSYTIQVPSYVLARAGLGADDPAVQAWIDEEVLYREGLRRGMAWNPSAIARMLHVGRFVGAAGDGHDDGHDDEKVLAEVSRLGLASNDPVIRAQVAGRMRLLLYAAAMQREPAGDELEHYFDEHRGRFARPSRATFSHVFVRRDRGPSGEQIAASIATRLQREGLGAGAAADLGDVFRPGHRFTSVSPRDIDAVLGPQAALAVMREPLRQWSAPVQSAYGWHVLRVEERSTHESAPLADIRATVLQAWRSERARDEVARRLQELRARYLVVLGAAS